MATRSNDSNRSGGPDRTSNQGRKTASGGEREVQTASTSGGGQNTETSRGGGAQRSKDSKGKNYEQEQKQPSRRK